MTKFAEGLIDRVKGVPLEKVIDEISGSEPWTRSGQARKRICMFHVESTPSFTVNGTNRYKCYGGGCGAKGNTIDFVMAMKKVDFSEAVRYLAREFLPDHGGVELRTNVESTKAEREFNLDSPKRELLVGLMRDAQSYYQEQLQSNSSDVAHAARAYVTERGLDRVVEQLGIGFAPGNDAYLMRVAKRLKRDHEHPLELLQDCGLVGAQGYRAIGDRVTFPITTYDGTPLGFTARLLHEEKKRAGKYKNTPQCVTFSKRHVLYGLQLLDKVKVKGNDLYLVEGITDLAGFIEQELPQALALGSTALTEHHVGILTALNPKRIIMMTDGDAAGARGALANVNRLRGTHDVDIPVLIAPFYNKEDPFDVFFTRGVSIPKYVRQHALPPSEFLVANAQMIRASFPHPHMFDNFLANNAGYIVPEQDAHYFGIYGLNVKAENGEKYFFKPPHKYLLQDRPVLVSPIAAPPIERVDAVAPVRKTDPPKVMKKVAALTPTDTEQLELF